MPSLFLHPRLIYQSGSEMMDSPFGALDSIEKKVEGAIEFAQKQFQAERQDLRDRIDGKLNFISDLLKNSEAVELLRQEKPSHLLILQKYEPKLLPVLFVDGFDSPESELTEGAVYSVNFQGNAQAEHRIGLGDFGRDFKEAWISRSGDDEIQNPDSENDWCVGTRQVMQREGGEGAGYRDVEPTNKRYLEIRTGYTFTFFRELTDTAKQKLKQDWIRNNSPQIGIEPADQQEPIGLSFYLDRAGVIEDESAVHNQWIRQVEEEEEFQDKIAAARGNLKMSDLDLSKLLRGAELLRDEQFMNKLDEVCGRLQINTVDLITVMQAESLLNPTAINPQSGASGLIQFMPKTARGLGTSVEAIRNMDPIDQLDLVEQYYSRYRGRMNNYADLYLATFYPRALYRGLDFVLGSEESADRVRVIANQNRKSVLNAAGKPNQSYITKRDFLKYCQVKQRNILANLQIA